MKTRINCRGRELREDRQTSDSELEFFFYQFTIIWRKLSVLTIARERVCIKEKCRVQRARNSMQKHRFVRGGRE